MTTCCSAAHLVATQGRPVATEHSPLQQTATRCNLLQRVQFSSAGTVTAQRARSVAAHDNLLQRMATCCSAAHPSCNAVPSVATDRSPGATCCSDWNSAQRNHHSRSAASVTAQQHHRLRGSATGCNARQSVATDNRPLQPVAVIAPQRSSIAAAQRAQSVAAHDHLLQHMTTCCSAAQPVATPCRPLQPTTARCNLLQMQRSATNMATVQRLPQRSSAIGCNTAARPRRRRLPGRPVHGVPSQSLARECNHRVHTCARVAPGRAVQR